MSIAGSRQVILVAGMHRSGTSAVARCLNILGADLGACLMPAAPDNVTGFWENSRLVDVNDRLLGALGSSWDDPSPLPSGWLELPVVQPFRNEILSTLCEEMGQGSVWAIKDPRICLLLPLWTGIFEQLGMQPKFVIPVRNPLEVVASLGKRNGMPLWQAQYLWLRHLVAAERGSRGFPRVFIDYDGLLSHTRETLESIESALGIDFPTPVSDAETQLSAFLSQGLRHFHMRSPSEYASAGLSQWAAHAYSIFVSACKKGAEADFDQGLSSLEAELSRAAPILHPALATMVSEQKKRSSAEQELGLHQQAREGSRRELAELRESLVRSQSEHIKTQNELAVTRHLQGTAEREQHRVAIEYWQLREQVTVLNEQLTQIRGTLRASEQVATDLGAMLRSQQESAAAKDQALSAAQNLALATKDRLDQSNAQLDSTKSSLETATHRLAQLEENLSELSLKAAPADAMLTSRAWRSTYPVRRLLEIVRGRGRNTPRLPGGQA